MANGCSTAASYLHPVAKRKNLTILTRSHATKIRFDGKRATGIYYRRNGKNQSSRGGP